MNTVFQKRYFGEQRTGSNTAVTNKNVCGPLLELPFVSIMRRTRQIHPLGHMFAYDQKWSYPAYPAKWPNVFSLLDLGITVGFFLFELKHTVKRQKFAGIEIFQNACHVSEGNSLRGDQNHFEQGHISVERVEIPGRDAFKPMFVLVKFTWF